MKKIRSWIHQQLLLVIWLIIRPFVRRVADPKTATRTVLIHCDPGHLVGSLGDEAMMMAAFGETERLYPGRSFYINTASVEASKVAAERGMVPFPHSVGILMPIHFLRRASQLDATVGYLMGADMMDGHYSPVVSLRMIISADLMARLGMKVSFLGFSMNRSPARSVALAFRLLHADVRVGIRDPRSLARFEGIATHRAELVADTAFLLKPSLGGRELSAAKDWIDSQKRLGRRVFAINIHPLLFKAGTSKNMSGLIRSISECMQKATSAGAVSWICLPHDNRVHVGDEQPLRELYEGLPREVCDNVYLIPKTMQAQEVKGLCGYLDGVVAGRMHLAIAALGMGVPVLLFDYQDKFKGLVEHFGLPEKLVLDALSSLDVGYLHPRIQQFIESAEDLRAEVAKRLPSVLALSRRNYAEDVAIS